MKEEAITHPYDVIKTKCLICEEKDAEIASIKKTMREVGEKMPEKKSFLKEVCAWRDDADIVKEIRGECKGFNKALDQCTKVATRLVAKKDAEIEALKKERNDAVESLNHLRFMIRHGDELAKKG